MTMSKLTLGLVGMIAVGGLAASLAIWHSGQMGLREQAKASRQQTEQLAQLSAEYERLSHQVARAKGPQSLQPDQLRELLRLRGQIGMLRQAGKEMVQLQATNEQLRAAMAVLEKQLAEVRAVPNFWAKEQLTFAGYAEPEAALKTLLWAMNRGDVKSYVACWVSGPEGRTLFDRPYEQALREKAEADMAAGGKMLADGLSPSIGFHILNKRVMSPDEVILNLSFDGEGRTRRFVVKKLGSEWKLADVLSPGGVEP
jgi:hypothetical protein